MHSYGFWFGHKAWLDGPIPRLCRLGVAAYLLVGIIAGLVEYKYGGPFMGPFEFQMIMILFQFPFLALVLVGALEGIRWILEWTDKKPKER